MKHSFFILLILTASLSKAYTREADSSKQNTNTKIFGNSIKFSAGHYYTRDVLLFKSRIHQLGIHYERRVYKSLNVGAGFAQWKTIGRYSWGNYQEEAVYLSDMKVGDLEGRYDYKMLDLYVSNRLDLYKQHHFLNVGVGASYTWGTSVYLDWIYRNPYGFDVRTRSIEKEENYWGVIPSISYDYIFLHNRLTVGVNTRARCYFGFKKVQYDYGLHFGVNF